MKILYISTSFLILLSSPSLWANDIKPGEWSVERIMKGDHLPSDLPKEKATISCITDRQARDMEELLRQGWQHNACSDSEVERIGNTLTWTTQCSSVGEIVESRGSMTIHDQKHYSGTVTNQLKETTTTIEVDAQWAGPCKQ